MGIVPGEPWGEATSAAPDLTVEGDDADLAARLVTAPKGALVRFVPSATSDLARAVGLRADGPPQGIALPLDVLDLGEDRLAVSTVVLGAAPDRLTAFRRRIPIEVRLDGRDPDAAVPRAAAVVVATGQWLRGNDLVPRGHPGDGKAEVQAYLLRPGERAAMRARLPAGTHLPHPRIVTRTARSIELRTPRPLPLEVDGRPAGPVSALTVALLPARYRLLV